MKLIMENWKRFIKEVKVPQGKDREYYIEDPNLSLTVETSDGKQHVIKALEIETGWYGDTSQGAFKYSINNEEYTWELTSGWYPDGAAWRILEHLGEDGSENNSDEPTEIEETIERFIESQVKRNPNYEFDDEWY